MFQIDKLERQQRASCAGKVRHESPSMAKTISRKRKYGGRKHVNVYSCRFCGGWHVGRGEDRR